MLGPSGVGSQARCLIFLAFGSRIIAGVGRVADLDAHIPPGDIAGSPSPSATSTFSCEVTNPTTRAIGYDPRALARGHPRRVSPVNPCKWGRGTSRKSLKKRAKPRKPGQNNRAGTGK